MREIRKISGGGCGQGESVESLYNVIFLLGGLGMFLYGMRTMGDGLKSSSGGAMKAALAKVTNKPVMGFILGMLVTCMIQSSTATIVLTVGLVGAGFLTFRQSVGIVFGANVGTAITAQIIRLMDLEAGADSILSFFKSDNLASVALIVGTILILFVKKRGTDTIGTILMGFGILFMGLMNMSAAVSGMGDRLSHLLVSFEDNYFLGFLAGVGVTGIIQSSSAVVGIVQTIASSVGVTFCGIFAVIIGVNIGDCLTTYLVCRIGARPEQIKTCLVHVVYNVIAAVLIMAALFALRTGGVLSDDIWYQTLRSGGVANVHGLFRLVPAVLLLPFSGLIAKVAESLVPKEETDAETDDIEKNLRELDPHLIINPALALEESGHLIGHMGDVALKSYNAAVKQLSDYKEKRAGKIEEREELLDHMADASNQYIVSVSPHVKLDRDNRTQSYQIKALTCFERIGDLALDFHDGVTELHENNQVFSPMDEMTVVTDAVRDILSLSVEAYHTDNVALALRVEPLEEVIDELIADMRDRHVYRMTHNECAAIPGIVYQNMLGSLERISDQCSDLAVYMLSRRDASIEGREHMYLHNLHHSNNKDYMQEFNGGFEKYFGRLNAIPVSGADLEKSTSFGDEQLSRG